MWLQQLNVFSSGVAVSLGQGLIRMLDTLMYAQLISASTAYPRQSILQTCTAGRFHVAVAASLTGGQPPHKPQGHLRAEGQPVQVRESGSQGCAAGLQAPDSYLRAAPVRMFIARAGMPAMLLCITQALPTLPQVDKDAFSGPSGRQRGGQRHNQPCSAGGSRGAPAAAVCGRAGGAPGDRRR